VTLEELLRRFIRDALHEKVRGVPDVPISGGQRSELRGWQPTADGRSTSALGAQLRERPYG
jgi:hypothetical protein